MALSALQSEKTDVLRASADRVRQWLEDNPPPAMPEYVSTVDGHVLRLDPSQTMYVVISGLGDPHEARVTAQRLSEAARHEQALRSLGLWEPSAPEDDD